MAGRRLQIKWRDDDTAEAMKAVWQADMRHNTVRVQGLWMLRRGMSVNDVAFALDVHYCTVRRWAKWYRSGGLEEVTARRRGGKGGQSRLSEEQVRCLAWELATGRLSAAADVKRWIAVQYGVRYTMPGVYSLMQRARAENVQIEIGSPVRQESVQREHPGIWRRITARVLRFISPVRERLARIAFR